PLWSFWRRVIQCASHQRKLLLLRWLFLWLTVLLCGCRRLFVLNRDRQGTLRADGIEDALDVFGRTGVGVVSVAHLGHRQEFLEQRSKFQFREERAKRVDVRVTGVHGVDVEFRRYIRVD